jgi:hypothetical protein
VTRLASKIAKSAKMNHKVVCEIRHGYHKTHNLIPSDLTSLEKILQSLT